MTVEEKKCAEGLVLGGGGHVALHGQMGEEGFHLCGAHVLGVALVVEKDVAFDPVDVGLLGADGVVLQADDVANLIEQFLGTLFHFEASFRKFVLAWKGKAVYTLF